MDSSAKVQLCFYRTGHVIWIAVHFVCGDRLLGIDFRRLGACGRSVSHQVNWEPAAATGFHDISLWAGGNVFVPGFASEKFSTGGTLPEGSPLMNDHVTRSSKLRDGVKPS